MTTKSTTISEWIDENRFLKRKIDVYVDNISQFYFLPYNKDWSSEYEDIKMVADIRVEDESAGGIWFRMKKHIKSESPTSIPLFIH
jgi:hypothetical protein